MKRLLALLTLTLALPAFAADGPPPNKGGPQPKPDPAAVAAKEAEHMKEGLQLTDDQAAKVKDILSKNINERMELEKKLREQDRRIHEAIRALLTDEQKERFDMMRAYRAMHRDGMHHGMHPGMRPGMKPGARPDGDDDAAGPPPPPPPPGGDKEKDKDDDSDGKD